MLNLRIKLDNRRNYMFASFEQETNDNSGKKFKFKCSIDIQLVDFRFLNVFFSFTTWLANRCLKEQKLFCSEIFNMVLFCKFQPAFIEHA